MLRIVTAIVLLPVLWVMIEIVPAEGFLAFAVVMIGVACWEAYRMLEARGDQPFKWLGLIAAALVTWSASGLWPAFDPGLPLVTIVFLCVVLGMRLRPGPVEMLQSTMTTLFPLVMIALALAHTVALRWIPGEQGPDLVMLLFCCVIASDTAAYYVGSTIGRHRMMPRLSPRKTWEGVAGGLAGSIGAACLARAWFYQELPLVHALVLGLLLGMTGILGDLAESLLKRATGVKDSSKLLPGHGGVLDRTDSLLFSAPILYYYYVIFLQVGT